MSKRVKTNFETVNKGKYEIIPSEKIGETNKRVSEAMKNFRKITKEEIEKYKVPVYKEYVP